MAESRKWVGTWPQPATEERVTERDAFQDWLDEKGLNWRYAGTTIVVEEVYVAPEQTLVVLDDGQIWVTD